MKSAPQAGFEHNTKNKMRHTKYDIRYTKYENGFTIVELLLALAITAMLLAAVAVAFNAAAVNYSQNEDIFKAVNSARQALYRITTQLRTATAVDPNSPSNECALITADSDNITYQYNSGDNKLYLIDSSPGSPYVLCDNVTAMTFTRTTAVDGGVTYVRNVQISMTVQSGDIQRKVAAAAVIRKNLK